MRVAIFSPLNPVKSGISDFTEELVMALKDYMNVDLFVDGYRPSNEEIIKQFNVYRMEDMDKPGVREKYDYLIFHVGNSASSHHKTVEYLKKYGGVLELHDYALHHYAAEATIMKGDYDGYVALMHYCHGERGLRKAKEFLDGQCPAPWDDCALEYPVNKHILDSASAVIVHSDYIKQMLKGINPGCRIINIPLHTNNIITDFITHSLKCKKQLRIPADKLMLASFGFATKPKRIMQILEALSELKKKTKDFLYYIIGQLEDDEILQAIETLSLQKHVITTGFVDLDTLKLYMGAVDIALNLRYPTQGESSGSLHRLLGMGKIVLVSKIGAFDEYRDDIVTKISIDENEISDITKHLIALSQDRQVLIERGRIIRDYAMAHYSLEQNAKKYYEFLISLYEKKYSETDYSDHLIDRLLEIECMDRDYVKSVGKRADEMMNLMGG